MYVYSACMDLYFGEYSMLKTAKCHSLIIIIILIVFVINVYSPIITSGIYKQGLP